MCAKESGVSYQLNHSMLKPFEPKRDAPAVDMSGAAIKRHPCHQCGDTFVFETSFVSHLQRKSLNISYACDACKCSLTFFNRCALLHHIRSHSERNAKLETSQVYVSPLSLSHLLPPGLANAQTFSHKTFNGTQCEPTRNAHTKDKTLSIKSTYVKPIKRESIANNIKSEQSNAEERDVKVKLKIEKDGNTVNDYKCSECGLLMNVSTRETHFGQNADMTLPSNQCKICPLICPTKCSQTVHNRLHQMSNSWICPECGVKFDQSVNNFITHVIINCLHFCRRLVYQCLYCSHKMSSLSAFIQHIKLYHTTSHYQCCECSAQFERDQELREHQTNLNHDSGRLMLFKCPICHNQFKTSSNYCEHIASHQKKLCGFAKFVFVCPECNQSFVSKSELSLHMDNFHGQNKNETEKSCFTTKLTRDISLQFKLKIEERLSSFSNNLSKPDNNCLKLNSNEKRSIEGVCDYDMNVNGAKTKRLNRNIGNLVNNSVNYSNQTNNVENVSLNGTLCKCNECKQTFPALQTLKRHLILEHSINNVESYINQLNVEIVAKVTPTEKAVINEDGEKKLSEILESEKSTESTCPVCLLKFANVKDLKIHGRVHGMAFIKSCQKKNT